MVVLRKKLNRRNGELSELDMQKKMEIDCVGANKRVGSEGILADCEADTEDEPGREGGSG